MSTTRFRHRNKVVSLARPDSKYRSSATQPWSLTPRPPVTYVDRDEMEDSPTQGFKRLSAQGEVIITPLRRVRSLHLAKPFRTTLTMVGTAQNPSFAYSDDEGNLFGPVAIENVPELGVNLSSIIEAIETEAITSAFANVGKADVELLVSIMELPETVAMMMAPISKATTIVNRYRRWRRALESFRARESKRAANLERVNSSRRRRGLTELPFIERVPPKFRVGKLSATDVPQAWLAVRYGLLPLMYDIRSIHDALAKSAAQPNRVTARGSASRSGTATGSRRIASGSYEYWHHYQVSYSVRSRGGVLYEPKPETFSSKWGLELHRLPAAAYEGIPLSFVTDWFHSAATYYDAITSTLRSSKTLGAWVTTTVEYTLERNFEARTTNSKPGGVIAASEGATPHGQTIYTIKTRRPASLGDTAPQIRTKLNLLRVVDGLALISTFLARRG